MSRKQAVHPATNCPSKGKNSEKTVKMDELNSFSGCGKVETDPPPSMGMKLCAWGAQNAGGYLFGAKRVTIHTLPRASQRHAPDAKTKDEVQSAMKKFFSIYKPDMFRAILYKTVKRASIALCVCLLWQRFLSDGTFTIWEVPCLAVGAVFLGWAWTSYLRLDGIRIPFLDRGRLSTERGQRRRGTHTMADFADEKIVSFDELSPEEKSFCSMLSSLILGVPMVLIGLVAGVL